MAWAGQSMRQDVRAAEERIRPFIRETPLERSPRFEELAGAACWVKLENLQHTGSFKVRGALNALLSLSADQLAGGVVVASTGNHGAAAAYAAARLGTRTIVYVPQNASPTKLTSMRRLGAEIRLHGRDGIDAELAARRHAAEAGLPYISPYNDATVIAGQGTVGLEIDRQLADFDAVFIAVGGGGLVSGVAAFLADRRPDVTIVGCSPENSAVMAKSVRHGRLLELGSLPTLSDGTAGGVEADAITFEPCRHLVDHWVDVSEAQIGAAMLEFIDAHHLLIEGAAGVALAAFVASAGDLGIERAVIIACGGNVSLDTLGGLLAGSRREGL